MWKARHWHSPSRSHTYAFPLFRLECRVQSLLRPHSMPSILITFPLFHLCNLSARAAPRETCFPARGNGNNEVPISPTRSRSAWGCLGDRARQRPAYCVMKNLPVRLCYLRSIFHLFLRRGALFMAVLPVLTCQVPD